VLDLPINCKQDSAVKRELEAKYAVVEQKQELPAPVMARAGA
jgi:hypothetical protein